ncbi:MAG TPA: molybdopterin biosynthesis protein [Chloroflexi bacterium]|nr:molybdopterin biosynthesis protein [Chloroflexota bacterium]
MTTRNIYLEDIPLTEAQEHWQKALAKHNIYSPLSSENIELHLACGRVTSKPIWALISVPHYHSAAMDGYAVHSSTTNSASETSPGLLPIPKKALYVDTGNPIPIWSDAVIPIENVQVDKSSNPHTMQFQKSASPWQHVRTMGEDMVATELVLPSNHRIRPVDIGAIAASGHHQVAVRRLARVAIIPTGDELVKIGSKVEPGQIIEYNSLMLAAQAQQWDAVSTRYPPVPDRKEAIKVSLLKASADHDLILLNAGSSRGSKDYSAEAISEIGTVLVHGIAVRPGHPVILGIINATQEKQAPTPVIGVPGYPVSTVLTGEILVEPLLAQWQGIPSYEPLTLEAMLPRKVLSPVGDDEYMRVAVGNVGDNIIATPLSRGAGVISSLVRADGIVRIPRFSEGHPDKSIVNVNLYRHPEQINRTIVVIGSHDLTLDLLAQHLADKFKGLRLVSANVGSISGLVALRREECHIAGCHLLDPSSGEYNLSYVKQYMPDTPAKIISLVERQQGLIVAKGNPKNILSIPDLARSDIRFINRQRGAGTRVFFDYQLGINGMTPDDVSGYTREQYTHLTVAASVASGTSDVGLGIHAATIALDLDFIPLATENYDLIIPHTYYETELITSLLELLNDPVLRKDISQLPGYSIANIGSITCDDTSTH